MSTYQRRLDLTRSTCPPFGVGAYVKGNILLIGEQASHPLGAPEQEPFCSDAGCSGWLNRLLAAEQIPEELLFWLNARNNDGSKVDLQSIYDHLQPSVVIGLGKVAEGLICEFDFRESAIFLPHPQYWKRFKSKQPYPLVKVLHDQCRKLVNNIQGLDLSVEWSSDKYSCEIVRVDGPPNNLSHS